LNDTALRSSSRVAAAIIVASVVVAGAILSSSYIGTERTRTITVQNVTTQSLTTSTTLTSTVYTVSCNYDLPGPCLTSLDFPISVSYGGPWKVTYEGYSDVFAYNPGESSSVNGTLNGFGDTSTTITVPSNGVASLCAQAQKLDDSSNPLVLNGQNETSLPYGSVSICLQAKVA